jgi:hypothetical protein
MNWTIWFALLIVIEGAVNDCWTTIDAPGVVSFTARPILMYEPIGTVPELTLGRLIVRVPVAFRS